MRHLAKDWDRYPGGVFAAVRTGIARCARHLQHLRDLVRFIGLAETAKLLVRFAYGQDLIPVRLRGHDQPLWMRRTGSDKFVFKEIFIDAELDVAVRRHVSTIVDGGAYVGYSTVFLAHRYPDARVLAVEPDPDNYELRQANTDWLSNVTTIHAALWDERRLLEIANPTDPDWSRRVTDQSEGRATVQGITIPDLLHEHGLGRIDLLKLDVEGAEERLLRPEADCWLRDVDTAIIESHGAAAEAALERVARVHGLERTLCGGKYVLRAPARQSRPDHLDEPAFG